MKYPVRRRAALFALFTFLAAPAAGAQQPPAAPEDPRLAEFKQLAAQVVERRRSGADESEEFQEKTLELLDSIILEQLNRTGPQDLVAINQRLAASLARPGAIGESYEGRAKSSWRERRRSPSLRRCSGPPVASAASRFQPRPP